jgi:hypothetical protein
MNPIVIQLLSGLGGITLGCLLMIFVIVPFLDRHF